MIIVREVFIAKPGMASKLAAMFKAEMGKESKVMTDMTGVFNKVVIDTQYEDMAAFDREMQEDRLPHRCRIDNDEANTSVRQP